MDADRAAAAAAAAAVVVAVVVSQANRGIATVAPLARYRLTPR